MPRLVPSSLCLVAGFAGLAACGDDGGTFVPVDAAPERMPLCTATVSLTGTFTPSAVVDPAGGCQPAGSWQVTVATADKGNCATVHTNPTYAHTVTGDPAMPARSTAVTYTTPASGESDVLTITGDNGQCTGNFEHVLANGTQFDQISLHPRTPKFSDGSADMSPRALVGDGEYDLWAEAP